MKPRHAGYTLLEVLVVFVILAIAGAVAAPAFASLRPASRLDSATSRIVGVMQMARERALAGGVPTEAVFDATGARVWLHPRDTAFAVDLPDGCHLDGPARSVVHFAADGPARGEAPAVVCGAERARIVTDPLTGASTVREHR